MTPADQPTPGAPAEATSAARIAEMDADRIAEIKDWVTDGTAPSCVTEMLAHIDALRDDLAAARAGEAALRALYEWIRYEFQRGTFDRYGFASFEDELALLLTDACAMLAAPTARTRR